VQARSQGLAAPQTTSAGEVGYYYLPPMFGWRRGDGPLRISKKAIAVGYPSWTRRTLWMGIALRKGRKERGRHAR